MSRILITGGAGFIGSHLSDWFLGRGDEIVCLDNLSTGSLENIGHLNDERFSFVKHDVTEYIRVDGDVDAILHFASPASPADYLDLPIQTLKVGSLGTHKALGLAKAKGAVFMLASTSEVYGDPLVHPQKESYWGNVNPIGPRGVYDEAKRFAEAMVTAYHRYHGVETRIARIFNTYGPRMRIKDGRAIPNFITQALRGEDITVYGDGSQTRSFCSIRDMVPGFASLLEKGGPEPVNLGNPGEYSVLELAEKIVAMTASKSRIVHLDLPEDDPKVRQPDITEARRRLRWEPAIDLDDGLRETVDYFRRALSSQAPGGGTMSGRILVTGGAGFIGSHVADAFLARGWTVSVVDDLSTGRRRNIPAGCAFHETDIRDRQALARVFAAASPQVVCHHAAQTSVRISTRDPAADLGVNILGTVNLLELSREGGVEFFSFASTGGAIYGDGVPIPTPEETPCRPTSPYGVAKLGAEHYIAYAEAAYGFPCLRLRYANVYGPRQDPHGEAGVVAIFSRRMLSQDDPVVNGDGRQTRDYVYVGDVVEANVRGVEKRLAGAYNVGTGKETDVVELFDTIGSLTGFKGEREHGPAQPGEQARSCLDTSLLARDFGWVPGTALAEGLARTVHWFEEHPDEN